MNHEDTMILIPAKTYSSRCEGKNHRIFASPWSLTQLAVRRAFRAKCGDVYVSSDHEDPPICGACLLRRKEENVKEERLGGTIKESIFSAMRAYGKVYKYIVVTLPTSPFATYEHIQNALSWFKTFGEEKGFKCLMSMSNVAIPLVGIRSEDNGEFMPGAIADEAFRPRVVWKPNGVVWIARVKDVVESENPTQYMEPIYGYKVNDQAAVDIDTELDFQMAQALWWKGGGL